MYQKPFDVIPKIPPNDKHIFQVLNQNEKESTSSDAKAYLPKNPIEEIWDNSNSGCVKETTVLDLTQKYARKTISHTDKNANTQYVSLTYLQGMKITQCADCPKPTNQMEMVERCKLLYHNGYTQQKIADMLGISQPQVSKLLHFHKSAKSVASRKNKTKE